MIVDTTVSFYEQRVCMAQQLYEAIERKRAKKQQKKEAIKNRKEIITEISRKRNVMEESQKGFSYLVESMNRLSVYLQCAHVNCYDTSNQTAVEISGKSRS